MKTTSTTQLGAGFTVFGIRLTRWQGLAVLLCMGLMGVVLVLLVLHNGGESIDEIAEQPPTAANGGRQSLLDVYGLRETSAWDNPQTSREADLERRHPGESAAASGTTDEILQRLSQLVLEDDDDSPEAAEEFNRLIQELGAMGEEAVPEIRAYLASGKNANLRLPQRGREYAYPTMRIAMVEALIQIGGEAAVEAMAEAMSKTTDEREMILLTFGLETHAPGQYREQAMSVALDRMSRMSESRRRWRNAAPLFEMVQYFGDASVAPQLEQAVGQWHYFATIALAGLPDGGGIPSLVRLAKDPSVTAMGSGDYALRPLAELAIQYPEARSALIEQAVNRGIPDTAWPSVAASLAGKYLRFGDRTFQDPRSKTVWTRDAIAQRLGLIDQLISVTTSPQGKRALQEARDTLTASYVYAVD